MFVKGRAMQVVKIRRVFLCSESGMSIIETLVALAVLATIAVAFLTGVASTTRAAATSDAAATAESLARSQMEWAQSATYVAGATSYSAAPIPGGQDYTGYSAAITAAALHSPDDGIQKITATVSRSGREVMTLVSYKVNR